MAAASLQSLVALLQEMRRLIEGLDDVEYAMPAPGRSSGGIGGHVRHCLDHVRALLAATETGLCAYDRRARNTAVETNRSAARRAASELTAGIEHLDPACLERDVLVETQLDHGGTMITTRSTFGRELLFVISHTIHHNAIVAQMLRARGVSLGPRFGLAPATPSDGPPHDEPPQGGPCVRMEPVACAR
jgi:uncharacterized damage-inducible protein DinB